MQLSLHLSQVAGTGDYVAGLQDPSGANYMAVGREAGDTVAHCVRQFVEICPPALLALEPHVPAVAPPRWHLDAERLDEEE